MATLSAPSVGEPLYTCAATVIVEGYAPGATIDIYADADHIGGGVSFSASGQVFGVTAANMVADAKITATQTLGADVSPPSPHLTVQTPLGLDPPVLNAPLFECACCVRVDGMLPGAKAQVRLGAAVLGQSAAAGAAVSVPVSPALGAAQVITARQVHCGTPGPDTPGVPVTASKKDGLQLAAPEVEDPLFACEQSAAIYGCLPGAQVELFVNMGSVCSACCSGTAISFGVSGGLVKGTSITVRQTLCGGAIQSLPSTAVVVQPTASIPKPAIWPPLYEGDTSVPVAMTESGETVTIEADSVQIGMGGAGGGTVNLNVDPPLTAGQKIVAIVELCSVKKSSLPVTVLPPPKTVPAPTIVKPLNSCSLLVSVTGCLAGAEVRVYAESGGKKVLLGVDHAFDTAVTVDVTPALKLGWSVTATQKIGSVTSLPSVAVAVQAAPAPTAPTLAAPIYACARCVLVKGTIPGARLDVYQNGFWVGGRYAASEVTEVDVYPGLGPGTTITATQTVCGKPSKEATAKTVAAPEKLLPPKLLPAYANRAYVEATDLVPGAIVEVEETSVYHMVVGKHCVTSKTATVGLNLPLFAGAKLRARQRLCSASGYSQPIGVNEPVEWPLGTGPYKAGFRLLTDVPISPDLDFISVGPFPCNGGTYTFSRPAQNKAIVYYPATAEGENTPFAAGGPFPLIVYAPGRRKPSCLEAYQVCLGAPEGTDDDYRQLSGITAHLARWGMVTITPDLSWLAPDYTPEHWEFVIADAGSYMLAATGSSGSPFQGKLKTPGIALMGHSSGGLSTTYLATGGAFTVDALALLAPANPTQDAQIANFAPKPVIVFYGTKDTGPYSVDGQALDTYNAAGAKKHLVTIDGANHFGYTDSLCILQDGAASINQADQQRIAKAYLTAFFRRYLNGVLEVDDYLTGAREVEELESFTITVDAQI